jgi:hypothetical protein
MRQTQDRRGKRGRAAQHRVAVTLRELVQRTLEQLAGHAEREVALHLPAARRETGQPALAAEPAGRVEQAGLADPGRAEDDGRGAAFPVPRQ